jgi:hypothetical protein
MTHSAALTGKHIFPRAYRGNIFPIPWPHIRQEEVEEEEEEEEEEEGNCFTSSP